MLFRSSTHLSPPLSPLYLSPSLCVSSPIPSLSHCRGTTGICGSRSPPMTQHTFDCADGVDNSLPAMISHWFNVCDCVSLCYWSPLEWHLLLGLSHLVSVNAVKSHWLSARTLLLLKYNWNNGSCLCWWLQIETDRFIQDKSNSSKHLYNWGKER